MKYTKESLQKTWGLVESKEHADYISEQCKSVGIISSDTWRCEYGYFSISLNELLFWGDESHANCKGKKQITIPLPPKREEFPKQVIATGKIFNRDSDGLYRWVSDCGKMEVIRPLESLEGEGDFTILSCESSSDEWPKVGDTVSLRYRFDSKQVMHTGKLLYLSSNHIIIKTENGNDCHCIRSEWDIEKPKTPEQDLREFLHLLWRENNEYFDGFADIAVLHLTKKG